MTTTSMMTMTTSSSHPRQEQEQKQLLLRLELPKSRRRHEHQQQQRGQSRAMQLILVSLFVFVVLFIPNQHLVITTLLTRSPSPPPSSSAVAGARATAAALATSSVTTSAVATAAATTTTTTTTTTTSAASTVETAYRTVGSINLRTTSAASGTITKATATARGGGTPSTTDSTTTGYNDDDIETTTHGATNTNHHHLSYCLAHRGTSGRWYDDPDFSRQTFYRHGFRSTRWFRATKSNTSSSTSNDTDVDVYPGNRYNWQDDTSTSSRNSSSTRKNNDNNKINDDDNGYVCSPIRPLKSKEMFCDVVLGLEVGRIMFVGDSLTKDQRESMMKLIGQHNLVTMPDGEYGDATVECYDGHGDKHSILITMHRENLGPNLHPTMTTLEEAFPELTSKAQRGKQMLNFGTETPYCKGETPSAVDIVGNHSRYYCPWHRAYQDYYNNRNNGTSTRNQRMLLILNQGAHFHSIGTFKRSLDQFVSIFKDIGRPDDILVYRSTAPGHQDCFDEAPVSSVVNMTYDIFLQRYATTKYDWHLFDEYNQYARRTLEKEFASRLTTPRSNTDVSTANTNNTKLGSVHFHYLNVYNMTVLRPDQHVQANDCLHYMLPGPVDFWNHLLFTNLQDIRQMMHLSEGSEVK